MPLTDEERRTQAQMWKDVAAVANAAAIDAKRDELPLNVTAEHIADVQAKLTAILQLLIKDIID